MVRLICFLFTVTQLGQITECQTLIIKNTNVVNVRNGSIARNVSVVIRNNRITAVVKNGTPYKGQIVDGRNKYLIPGLWDMHTHNWNAEPFFPLLLTNGVTGIRDMFGSIDSINRWRAAIATGQINGPVIFASGPIVDGPKPVWPGSVAISNPEQVPRIVDSLKNTLKVDFIKVYSLLSRPVYFRIAEEAKRQNIPFEGHLPNEISVLEAARAGQKSQEHLLGFIQEASDSSDYLQKIARKLITDTILQGRTARMKMLIRSFNKQKLVDLVKELAKYDSWICPTLVVNRNIAFMNDTGFINDNRLHYMMPAMKDMWNPANDPRFNTVPPEYYELYKKLLGLMLITVKEMQQAGIKLLAGTDYPNPYCFPGFSLHDELDLMVQAGLSPLQALQTATINPALFLNISADYGTAEPGKVANLVLLDKNPLENIAYTKCIHAVIVNGNLLDKEKLQMMLKKLWHE